MRTVPAYDLHMVDRTTVVDFTHLVTRLLNFPHLWFSVRWLTTPHLVEKFGMVERWLFGYYMIVLTACYCYC